jgi:hypothetical protein
MSRLRRLVLSDWFSFITCRLLRGRARLAEGRTTEFEKAALCATRFTVERRWQVGKQPAGVRNPKTGNVYDYEVNKNDYDANPPIQTEYHNDE